MMTLALVELGQQVEQQGSARGTERQIAELVEDDQVGVSQAMGHLAAFVGQLLLLEQVHEFHRGEEANAAPMMLQRLHANGGGQVRLARSRRSSHIVPANRLSSWFASITRSILARAMRSRFSADPAMARRTS